MAFKKALIERAMGAELRHHLGYRDGEPRPEGQANYRNGHTGKTVLTDDGPVRIAVPRDHDEASCGTLQHEFIRSVTHELLAEVAA